MPWCIQHGHTIYHYYPISSSAASDKEGSLQTRPGTDYFQRNCNPEFTPVDMMDVGSSMTSFVGSGFGSELSLIDSGYGGLSRPTSPQGSLHQLDFTALYYLSLSFRLYYITLFLLTVLYELFQSGDVPMEN